MSSILKALQRVEAEEQRGDTTPPMDPGFVAQPGEPLRRTTPRWVVPLAGLCLAIGLVALIARWLAPIADAGAPPAGSEAGQVAERSAIAEPAATTPEPAPAAVASAPDAQEPVRLPPGAPRDLPADPDYALEIGPVPLPRRTPAPGGELARTAPPSPAPEAEAAPSEASPPTTAPEDGPPPAPARAAASPEPQPAPVVAATPSPQPAPVVPATPSPEPAVEAPREPAPSPAKAAPSRPAPAPPPSVVVERTVWHPTPARREATVRVEGFAEPLSLREGDAVGVLVVSKIEPSGVVFLHGTRELRHKVGAR